MTPICHFIRKFICLAIIIYCLLPETAHAASFGAVEAIAANASAANFRKPVCSGNFYPDDKAALIAMIDRYSKMAQKTDIDVKFRKNLKALILPHAGYIYSGLTAAHASIALKGKNNNFNKIILMGPDHRVGIKNCAVSDVLAYKTPMGNINLHRDAAELRRRFKRFNTAPLCDRTEHSIEVILPFLQVYLDNFEIIPIVMGEADAHDVKAYTEAVNTVIDKQTLVVASSDLSHYLSYSEAVVRDRETIEMILNLESDKLAKSYNRACGIIPIRVLMGLAKIYNWQPVLLHYSNSGETAGNKERVVGYTAIAFYGDLAMKNFNELTEKISNEKGKVLLELARKTIAEKLGIDFSKSKSMESVLAHEIFQTQRGIFVTLTINSQLRGCIGNLSPDRSIIEGVKSNAINAAFHDPRFSPLSKKEFAETDIEISLLTEPKSLEFSSGDELLARLRPDIDGVIIRKGIYSSTFLPQVWEQLPDKKKFLEHLCRKAGLPGNAWREPGLNVRTYQVQYFEEEN